jgi:quercetin dioxygenase-like cupin family protein
MIEKVAILFIDLTHEHFQEGIAMHAVKTSTLPIEPIGEATPIAGWTGGPVSRTRQTIIREGDSEDYRCSIVNFGQGATTGWHAHTCDQLLVITAGTGIVATEQEEQEVAVGDVVHIKAGERHWHGAKANTTMSHITITTADSESRR